MFNWNWKTFHAEATDELLSLINARLRQPFSCQELHCVCSNSAEDNKSTANLLNQDSNQKNPRDQERKLNYRQFYHQCLLLV